MVYSKTSSYRSIGEELLGHQSSSRVVWKTQIEGLLGEGAPATDETHRR